MRLVPAITVVSVILGAPGFAFAQDDSKGDIKDYLADVNAGAVSAGNLVGLTESAIGQIQTSQDLVLALKPFSSSSSKTGFGLAITPARTTLTPMSAQSYYRDWYMRLLGGATLSYAENSAQIAGVSYRKSAFSVDTLYFLRKADDPILVAHESYDQCDEWKEAKAKLDKAAEDGDREAFNRLKGEVAQAAKACIEKAKRRWNASRVSIGFGAGWIKPDDNSSGRASLGRSITLGGVIQAGKQGAAYVSLRRTTREVDLTTLGGTPGYKSATLAAARFTYGSEQGDGDIKVLAEVSNAKKNEVTVSNSAFKYAVGVDAKVAKGTWLEFRLGRSRVIDGTTTQTASLLTFKWAPSAGLFAK